MSLVVMVVLPKGGRVQRIANLAVVCFLPQSLEERWDDMRYCSVLHRRGAALMVADQGGLILIIVVGTESVVMAVAVETQKDGIGGNSFANESNLKRKMTNEVQAIREEGLKH